MTALAILAQAHAAGLVLRLADNGTIAVRGPADARARLLPTIKTNKPALVEALTETRRTWLVTADDGTRWESSFYPPATFAAVLAMYEGASVMPVPVPVPDPDPGADLPDDVERLVLTWLDAIGEDDPQTRREAVDLARSRPDIAQGYRDRAAAPAPPGPAPDAPGDPDAAGPEDTR